MDQILYLELAGNNFAAPSHISHGSILMLAWKLQPFSIRAIFNDRIYKLHPETQEKAPQIETKLYLLENAAVFHNRAYLKR